MESALRPPQDPDFRLIETLLWTPEGGCQRGDLHLKRLHHSAGVMGIVPVGADALLAGFSADGPARVRLTCDVAGRCAVTSGPFVPLPEDTVWRLALAEVRLDAGDDWLRHKTTRRAVYDADRAALPDGVDELIYMNTRSDLCEGTITNLFVPKGDVLVTPPISVGCLPGVLRSSLICAGKARVGKLREEDLQGEVYVGNSLRGLIAARLDTL
ncbi:MAG: aminotransferase class IV family protein [Pseudomonadota bacterium]|nr:aminotransferase class IV family protein [Pseudomonadota bacterium]MEE3070494.1 aminotransferase class IV family protein [Pseudomonadota bacterium]